ncbi:hypothetical protein JD969_17255 [Planctomycetota bacterium]|nr:hypothetical protein JD969_17255 [Planctomycetota bacterium]
MAWDLIGLIYWVSVGLIGGLAFVILLLGFRGRVVDDHPICKKCGYDLEGNREAVLKGDGGRCPECGACLDEKRKVKIGNRAKVRKKIVVGVAGLMLAAGLGGVRMMDLDFTQSKPVWYLRLEARRPGWFQNTSEVAMEELERRIEMGELSEDEISDVFYDGVRRINEEDKEFGGWGTILDVVFMYGNPDQAMMDAYLEAVLESVELKWRKVVLEDGRLPFEMTSNFRDGFVSMVSWEFHVSVDDGGSCLFVMDGLNRQGTLPIGRDGKVQLSLGERKLHIEAKYSLLLRAGGKHLTTTTREYDLDFKVATRFERDQLLKRVKGEKNKEMLRDALGSLEIAKSDFGQGDVEYVLLSDYENSKLCDLFFKVYLLEGEKRVETGLRLRTKEESEPLDSFRLEVNGVELNVGDEVDLVLVPDVGAVCETVDVWEFFDEEIVLRDVKVVTLW